MTVTWQVGTADTESYVDYGDRADRLDQRAGSETSRYPYETGVVRHSHLTGLRPGARYYYRVVEQGTTVGSFTRSFVTAPDSGDAFTFTAYGDQGVTPEGRQLVARVFAEQPAFHLHLGDLAYANYIVNYWVWDEWLDLIEPLASQIPYMPSLGNHENERYSPEMTDRLGYMTYLARFALPEPETWYAFDYLNARFVAFNSDDYQNPDQMKWFRETLHAAHQDPKVKWLIVYQHHPPYSSNVRRENNAGLIAALEPTLDEFRVDLVLAGHNHNYERTFSMRGGKVTHTDTRVSPRGTGTIYVISGGGGRGLYDFVPQQPEWCAAREKVHNYLRVNVTKDSLKVAAVRIDGTVIEEFAIK